LSPALHGACQWVKEGTSQWLSASSATCGDREHAFLGDGAPPMMVFEVVVMPAGAGALAPLR
jgi:hypothetical protein